MYSGGDRMVEEKKKKRTPVSPMAPGTALSGQADPTGLARGFDSIFDEFRQSFDELIGPFFSAPTKFEDTIKTLPTRYAQVDIIDNGDTYTVTAELPGFNKNMVNVEINKEGAAIKAKCEEDKQDIQKNYLHRERAYSSLQRYIKFPEEVIPSRAEGKMKDGILELVIPKKEPKPEEKPQKVQLK